MLCDNDFIILRFNYIELFLIQQSGNQIRGSKLALFNITKVLQTFFFKIILFHVELSLLRFYFNFILVTSTVIGPIFPINCNVLSSQQLNKTYQYTKQH